MKNRDTATATLGNAVESEAALPQNKCINCQRIYTNNDLCVHCRNVDPEKVYPSKIAIVYPEGSLHQKLATYAFNHLSASVDDDPELAASIASEMGATEDEVYRVLEELYTEN